MNRAEYRKHSKHKCVGCDYPIYAPSAEVVLQTPQTYGKSINPDTEIVSDLEALSAEAVQGWIPVSERLPEKDERVLVTAWGDVDIAWIDKYGLWQAEEYTYHSKDDILAWMPLPKPYDCGAKMVREDGEEE